MIPVPITLTSLSTKPRRHVDPNGPRYQFVAIYSVNRVDEVWVIRCLNQLMRWREHLPRRVFVSQKSESNRYHRYTNIGVAKRNRDLVMMTCGLPTICLAIYQTNLESVSLFLASTRVEVAE